MSKWRRAAKNDANQKEIVAALRDIPNVSVETGHDDLLIGHKGVNYWIEVKNKDGRNRLQESQKKLLDDWNGQYAVASSLDEILKIIGIKC